MYFNQSSSKAIAQTDLNSYLAQQNNAIAPLLKPIVPKSITVERVGFTRNASNTPYIVYRVNDRRCCTFVKRRWFFQCVQLLLKLKDGIEARIRTISSSPDLGLSLKTTEERQYIPSSYVNKFFTALNSAVIGQTVSQFECCCGNLFDVCPHRILAHFQLFCLPQSELNQPPGYP